MDTIQCQKCFCLNPPDATTCEECDAPLGGSNARGLMPGQMFADRYTLKTRIGEGDVGEVWRAEQSDIEHEVAIKFMHPELMRHDTTRRKMLAEGRALSHLSHPNLVQIVDVFETDNTVALVLELVKGGSMMDHLEAKSQLPWTEVVPLMVDILKGLDALHEANFIHRDLKPDNLLLAHDEDHLIPKCTEPGITSEKDAIRLSRNGSLLGRPEYMAPEQIKSGETSVASDIYACGVIMYQLLTGTLPFQGTDYEIRHQHVTEPPDSSRLPTNTPNWLAQIILTALAKAPTERYSSAEVFRSALLEGDGTAQIPAATEVHAVDSSSAASASDDAIVEKTLPIDDPSEMFRSRLKDLDVLLDQGLLNKDEYESRKSTLLDAYDAQTDRREKRASVPFFAGQSKGRLGEHSRSMSFREAVTSCFRDYAIFSGRATRSEYWHWTLFTSLVSFVALFIDVTLVGMPLFWVGTNVIFLVPSLAVLTRRLHDVGRSGWSLLFALIPYIGLIMVFIFLVSKSQEETNEYGPNPFTHPPLNQT